MLGKLDSYMSKNKIRTFSGVNHGKSLYDLPSRDIEIKTNINKWDLNKLKSFCTMKETMTKVRRQPSE